MLINGHTLHGKRFFMLILIIGGKFDEGFKKTLSTAMLYAHKTRKDRETKAKTNMETQIKQVIRNNNKKGFKLVEFTMIVDH